MTFGNLVALTQRHIVRLLAYSSIGQPATSCSAGGREPQRGSVNHEAFAPRSPTSSSTPSWRWGRSRWRWPTAGRRLLHRRLRGPRLPVTGARPRDDAVPVLACRIPPLAAGPQALHLPAVIDGHGYCSPRRCGQHGDRPLLLRKVVRRMFFEPAGDGRWTSRCLAPPGDHRRLDGHVLLVGILPDLAATWPRCRPRLRPRLSPRLRPVPRLGPFARRRDPDRTS